MGRERGELYNIEGLDATGKSTLAKRLKEAFRGAETYCPPNWMRPYRTFFNKSNPNMRFLYYALGNYWVDRKVVQPLLERGGQYVFQDRTWLTTLCAHEDMGTSPFWLRLGLKIATRASRPDIAFLIHVDNEIRQQRMMSRDTITSDDLESLNNQKTMEKSYVKWADRLQWNTVIFDNTHLTPDNAVGSLVNQINSRNALK